MKPVLIACECSQVECKAFRAVDVEAYSCDVQPAYGGHPEWHIKGDALETMYNGDLGLIIAHPPCTYLCVLSSVQLIHNNCIDTERWYKMDAAARFFYHFYYYRKCPVCVENPCPMQRACLPPRTQVICPTMFGGAMTKRTYLWLHDLPELFPTHARNKFAPSYVYHTHAGNKQCRSFEGVAHAMAVQWKPFIN